jgi:hypothetical protein
VLDIPVSLTRRDRRQALTVEDGLGRSAMDQVGIHEECVHAFCGKECRYTVSLTGSRMHSHRRP